MKKSYFFLVIYSFIFLPIFVGQTTNHSHDLGKKIDIIFDKLVSRNSAITGLNNLVAKGKFLLFKTTTPFLSKKTQDPLYLNLLFFVQTITAL